MLRKFVFGAIGAVCVLTFAVLVSYSTWKSERHAQLREGGDIVETSAGTIEYFLETGQGPVLLFLHGTPGGYDQVPDRSYGYRLLAPSRPGYLSTPIAVGRTPAEQAVAYAALLDVLEIDEVIVLGVSGGGPSAISFAASYPERTRALVAIEAVSQSIPLLSAPRFLESDLLVWLAFSTLSHSIGAEGIVKLVIPDPINQERVLASVRKQEKVESILWSVWPPSLRQSGTDNDSEQFARLDLPLVDVSVPTLIIHGTADANVPFSHAELLAETIPDAQLHAILGADHMMPFSHEEEVESIITEFFARIENVASAGDP